MTPQDIQIGDIVINWQGTYGKVTGITKDGWFQVKDLTSKRSGSDEWQGFQLRLSAKANGPRFFN